VLDVDLDAVDASLLEGAASLLDRELGGLAPGGPERG
jgi:hypothetical protein